MTTNRTGPLFRSLGRVAATTVYYFHFILSVKLDLWNIVKYINTVMHVIINSKNYHHFSSLNVFTFSLSAHSLLGCHGSDVTSDGGHWPCVTPTLCHVPGNSCVTSLDFAVHIINFRHMC